jgi:hypothetical protein
MELLMYLLMHWKRNWCLVMEEPHYFFWFCKRGKVLCEGLGGIGDQYAKQFMYLVTHNKRNEGFVLEEPHYFFQFCKQGKLMCEGVRGSIYQSM